MGSTAKIFRLGLMPGDSVVVRSARQIRDTLDASGCLDGLPFMPEMLEYCGQRFDVIARADKTCDTVNQTGGRRLYDTVHLDTLRCDGSAHGGCQAGCLIFWKEAWLTRADKGSGQKACDADSRLENLLRSASYRDRDRDTPAWRCQATALPEFTKLLRWWDVRQYIRDLRTGNTTFGRMMASFAFTAFRGLLSLGIGYRLLLRAYDRFQKLRGKRPYPLVEGRLETTPRLDLGLQAGELIRVKSLQEINATLDWNNKNRGLWFDQEMAKFCEGVYRVARRVDRILDERTGRMLEFNTPCVILENVFCPAEVSKCRLFCPRRIYPYWREIWLERIGPPG